jgi:hypothetical protein
MDGALGMLGKPLIVRDHANCRAASVEFFQQIHHRFAVTGIQVSGWFIRQQDGGLAGESSGDGNALLLTAGKLTR